MEFQSLTGSIHTLGITKLLSEIETGFNPSQVQFTQRENTLKRKFTPSFNPSQVQFTPDEQELEKRLKLMFQSLTGSIHTRVFDNEEV